MKVFQLVTHFVNSKKVKVHVQEETALGNGRDEKPHLHLFLEACLWSRTHLNGGVASYTTISMGLMQAEISSSPGEDKSKFQGL